MVKIRENDTESTIGKTDIDFDEIIKKITKNRSL